MKQNTPERRSQPRKPVRLPLKVRQADGGEQEGLTRDLTSNGIFFYSDGALESGTKLELVVMLPAELGLATAGWTLCQASVVRVEEETGGKGVGVAATLDRIELLPEIT